MKTKQTIIWEVPNELTPVTLKAEALIRKLEKNLNFSISFGYSAFPEPQFHFFNDNGIDENDAYDLQDKINVLLD